MKQKRALFFDATGKYTIFELYPLATKLPDTAGVYIYISDHYGDYRALYIDETENLNKIEVDAKTWQCVMGRFANAIGIHTEADRAIRQHLKQSLIACQNPVCNDGTTE